MDYPTPVTQLVLLETLVMLVKAYPSLEDYAVKLICDDNRFRKMVLDANRVSYSFEIPLGKGKSQRQDYPDTCTSGRMHCICCYSFEEFSWCVDTTCKLISICPKTKSTITPQILSFSTRLNTY